jgi:hypothetical protein
VFGFLGTTTVGFTLLGPGTIGGSMRGERLLPGLTRRNGGVLLFRALTRSVFDGVTGDDGVDGVDGVVPDGFLGG